MQDYSNPQSLNRYSYGLNNPLKYMDPTGHFVPVILALAALAVASGGYLWASNPSPVNAPAPCEPLVDSDEWASSKATAATFPIVGDINAAVGAATGHDVLLGQDISEGERGLYAGAAALPGVAGYVVTGGKRLAVNVLKGPPIMPASKLRKELKGTGLQVHHVDEVRHAETVGVDGENALAVAAEPGAHKELTNRGRSQIGYRRDKKPVRTDNATREQVIGARADIYRDVPEILGELDRLGQ